LQQPRNLHCLGRRPLPDTINPIEEIHNDEDNLRGRPGGPDSNWEPCLGCREACVHRPRSRGICRCFGLGEGLHDAHQGRLPGARGPEFDRDTRWRCRDDRARNPERQASRGACRPLLWWNDHQRSRNDPKVRSVVYIAAYAPDAGESVASLTAKPIPGYAPVPILPPQDGYLTVDISKFPRFFAADVDLTTTRFMAASQVPWGLAAVTTKIGPPAWKTKPTFFMITTEDHMIPTPQQRDMAARAHAHSVEIVSSHAVMLSHPSQVAAFIEKSAGAPQ
jgi:hypothetical protein